MIGGEESSDFASADDIVFSVDQSEQRMDSTAPSDMGARCFTRHRKCVGAEL